MGLHSHTISATRGSTANTSRNMLNLQYIGTYSIIHQYSVINASRDICWTVYLPPCCASVNHSVGCVGCRTA
eukprot:1150656-Pelagomonas_calceolata.AAC.1